MTGTNQPVEATAAAVAKTLEPYPEMKDSGVAWLGEVPAHWEVERGKRLLHCVDERSSTGDEELLTVSTAHGVVPRSSANVTMFKAESYAGYKLCWPGDLVINSLWAWAGGLGVSRRHGIISSAYGVYRPHEPLSYLPGYMHRFVRSTPFNCELHIRSKGIWTSRLQLTDEAFLNAPFLLPPPKEQTAIVRYLDYIDRRVRRLTKAKRKLVALLKEQKQALVHRAVTRGLDPDAPMKGSGVEWLGEVPAHWEVRRLKWLCSRSALYGANVASDSYTATGVRFLRTTDITEEGQLKPTGVFLPEELVHDYLLMDGDVLISRSGTIGRSFLYNSELHGSCAYAGYLVRFVPASDCVLPRYVFLYTKTQAFAGFLKVMAISSTIENVNGEKYANAVVPLPPLSEQTAIAEYLDKAIADIDAAIARADREVELLDEYRARLVADVVTGKLDVREAAAALPEVDPLAAEDETEETGLDETLTEADNIDASRETAAV